MKKEIIILIVLALIIVALLIAFNWPSNLPIQNNQNNGNTYQNVANQKVEGIQITSPIADNQITSPLKITGTVNGGGWNGFEGQVGTVQLLDGKGKELAKGVLKATSDWTQPPVQFETTLTFDLNVKGLAILLFANENPSGMPEKDKKFGLPVVIK